MSIIENVTVPESLLKQVRELSEKEMLDLMAEEYTFIKRPVLVSGEKAVAGFSEKNYEKFLNNE